MMISIHPETKEGYSRSSRIGQLQALSSIPDGERQCLNALPTRLMMVISSQTGMVQRDVLRTVSKLDFWTSYGFRLQLWAQAPVLKQLGHVGRDPKARVDLEERKIR